MTGLWWGVLGAAAVSMVGLVARLVAFLGRPGSVDLSRPRGSGRLGAYYALTVGMMPWVKESGRKHPLLYGRGVAFHLGILVAGLSLVAALSQTRLSGGTLLLLQVLAATGLVAGLIALVARAVDRDLRALSVPDDFAAMVVMDSVLATALGWLFSPAAAGCFYAAAIVMFLYIPVGKIRHCIFFFPVRIFFGLHFGHRGVLPHELRERGYAR